MELKTYLASVPLDERIKFAESIGTTVGYLNNLTSGMKDGTRQCGEKLASLIEAQSGGKVTRQELRPNDWWQIWPELAQTA